MNIAEQEVLSTVYELSGGNPILVGYDKVAAQLATTITAVKIVSQLLQNHKLAMATFGGVQLTAMGIEQAKHERELYAD